MSGNQNPTGRTSRDGPDRLSIFLCVLAGLYLPLAVAAVVPPGLLKAEDLLRPISKTLTISLLSYAIAWGLRRDSAKAALVSALVVTIYGSLGWAANALQISGADWVLGGTPGVVALFSVFLLSANAAILRGRREASPWVRFLTVMGLLLVAWDGGLVAWHLATARRLPAPQVAPGVQIVTHAASSPQPDIYLIVLDKMSGTDALASEFGLDNRDMELALRSRGFIVPQHPHANYIQTFLALNAMLNFDYLDPLTKRFGSDSRWDLSYPYIENNRLASFLQSRGYQFVFFPSDFWATRQNRFADLQLPRPTDVRIELWDKLDGRTAEAALRATACHVEGCDDEIWPYTPGTPALMDWRFHRIGSLERVGGRPMFVLAHLLVPHEPNIYGPHCEHLAIHWPFGRTESEPDMRRAYVAQVRCVNKRLLETIDSIVARSRVPPVILLQADHGHGHVPRFIPSLAAIPEKMRFGRASVFAGYLLPGVPADSVAPGITSINAVRLVLRHYFGAVLPALPDATFWSSTDRPYIFERVP